MPAIHYIKRYAKKLLNDYKNHPYYQSLRDNVGVEKLTMDFAKNSLAKNMRFESWKELSEIPENQKCFIKFILSHPYLHPSGVHDKQCVPNLSDDQWVEYQKWMIHYFTDPLIYHLTFRLLILIPDYLEHIESINYKTSHEELYSLLEPVVLKRLVPDGSMDYGTFVLGMLMSGFRAVKCGDKVYFNVSEKSVKELKQKLEFNKILHDANADCMSYDCDHPNGVLK